MRFYFKNKDDATFEEMLIYDLLALVLIYADCIALINGDEHVPSIIISSEYGSMTPEEWNDWLRSAKLTGV